MNSTDHSLVLKAISFASRQHVGQLRKDGQTPYAAHPMRVLSIMSTIFRVEDPEVLAAAALHDVIEDTTVDRDDVVEEFGERVASYVALLSKDKRLVEEERETKYFHDLAEAPLEVQLCKLADTYDNLIDSSGFSLELNSRFRKKSKQLVDLFTPRFPDAWHHVLEAVRAQIEKAPG